MRFNFFKFRVESLLVIVIREIGCDVTKWRTSTSGLLCKICLLLRVALFAIKSIDISMS